MKARKDYPGALVLVHPECRAEVIELADEALSTSQMARYVKDSPAKIFLIGTEEGLVYRLQKDNPDKSFHLISGVLLCPDMKKTTLEKVVETMEFKKNVVVVPEDIRIRAKRALDRMLAVV
jgi:quinolinate synthase